MREHKILISWKALMAQEGHMTTLSLSIRTYNQHISNIKPKKNNNWKLKSGKRSS